MDTSTTKLGGYQGNASILTKALLRLAECLQDSPSTWSCQSEVDAPSQGESANALFSSVEQGTRQICYVASGYLSARVPELSVLDLPFSVSDRRQALAALDGDAGELLAQAVAQKTNYQVLGFWDNGFRHLSNSVHPIRKPQDCEGLVIRTLDNAGYRSALNALGFEARTTDVKDLVRVIRSGEVHAQENPLTNLLTFELWRYHPYVSLTGHYFGVLLLVCNKAWYQALTPAKKADLTTAAASATTLQRQLAAEADGLALVELRKLGVQVLGPNELDMAALREATAVVTQATRLSLSPALLSAYLNTPEASTKG